MMTKARHFFAFGAALLLVAAAGAADITTPAAIAPTQSQTPAAPLVRAGQMIIVRVEDGALLVMSRATLLSSAAQGDVVRARLEGSGRIVQVRITSAGMGVMDLFKSARE